MASSSGVSPARSCDGPGAAIRPAAASAAAMTTPRGRPARPPRPIRSLRSRLALTRRCIDPPPRRNRTLPAFCGAPRSESPYHWAPSPGGQRMARGTPFHSRTAPLNAGLRWKEWEGYFVANAYERFADPEYHAVRSGGGAFRRLAAPQVRLSRTRRDGAHRSADHPQRARFARGAGALFGLVRFGRQTAPGRLLPAPRPGSRPRHRRGPDAPLVRAGGVGDGRGRGGRVGALRRARAPGADFVRGARGRRGGTRRPRVLPPARGRARRRPGRGDPHRLHRRSRLRDLGGDRFGDRALGRAPRCGRPPRPAAGGTRTPSTGRASRPDSR